MATAARALSKDQKAKEPKAEERADKYGKYKRVEFTIRLVDRALGAAPVSEDKIIRFERNGKDIVLRAKNFLAVLRDALRISNCGFAKVAIRNFYFEDVHPEKAVIGQLPLPSPGQFPGARGTGISIYETLEPGTLIPVRAMIPTSIISEKQFLDVWRIAGTIVRFSPSKARLGYGTFEVI